MMLIFSTFLFDEGPPQKKQDVSPAFLEPLLFKIAAEDLSAFEALYRNTDKTIYAYILSIIGNPFDAQDIMQDTYLKIRAGAHLYEAQGKPLAWIFTIAKNLAYMKLRSVRSCPTAELEVLDWAASPNLATNANWEDSVILKEALHILPCEERQIVLLHALSGFKHREIANLLDLPLSTVLSKYIRSLGKLKKHLIEMGVHL